MLLKDLENLTRKEIQQIAKENGIKANKKTIELINDIIEIFNKNQKLNENKEEIIIQNNNITIKNTLENLNIQEISNNSHENTTNETTKNTLECQEISKNKTVFDINLITVSNLIQFNYDNKIMNGKIKRLNKLSVRVILLSDNSEITVQKSDILGFYNEDEKVVEEVVEEEEETQKDIEIENLIGNEKVEEQEQIQEELQELKELKEVIQTISHPIVEETQQDQIHSETDPDVQEDIEDIQQEYMILQNDNIDPTLLLPAPSPSPTFTNNSQGIDLGDTEDTEIMTIEELENQENFVPISNVSVNGNVSNTNITTRNGVEPQSTEFEDNVNQSSFARSPFKYNEEVHFLLLISHYLLLTL